MVECLPSNHEALNSNPDSTKKYMHMCMYLLKSDPKLHFKFHGIANKSQTVYFYLKRFGTHHQDYAFNRSERKRNKLPKKKNKEIWNTKN
jgi:hypothetical protein